MRCGAWRSDGVTVFLTTQYLEEADVLADRVGIIDHGKIVAEGTPSELKAADRPSERRGGPAGPGDRERLAGVLAALRRGGRGLRRRRGGAAARGRGRSGRDRARARRRGPAVADLRLHSPTLDDVFLAKTGRSLEGAGDERERAEDEAHAGRARRAREQVTLLTTQVGALARRSMLKTLRQPFQMFPIVFFPAILLAVNASGLRAATHLPGFPTHSYISFAIAVAFIQGGMFSLINTGTNLAEDIESGFFNRLALTPTATGRR